MDGNWFWFYGNENWEYDVEGYMVVWYVSINDFLIMEEERKFCWL